MEMGTAYRSNPLKSDFGLEIVGLDVTRASNSELGEVAAAIFQHGAVVLRDQLPIPA
jgi:alpha-ketoglutarate-dependent taurine dioxygenase